MAAERCKLNRNENTETNVKPKSQQGSKRLHSWNRAIPEAGYITLGTIRYGIRPSPDSGSVGYLPGGKTVRRDINLLTGTATEPNNSESQRASSRSSASDSKNNDQNDEGDRYDLCCCSPSAGFVAPCWKVSSCCNNTSAGEYTAHNRSESSPSSKSSSSRSSSGRYTTHTNRLNEEPLSHSARLKIPQFESKSKSEFESAEILMNGESLRNNQSTMKMSSGVSSYSRRSTTPPSRLRATLGKTSKSSAQTPSATIASLAASLDSDIVSARYSSTNVARNSAFWANGNRPIRREPLETNSVAAEPCCRESESEPIPLPSPSKIAPGKNINHCQSASVSSSASHCCYTIANNSKAISRLSNTNSSKLKNGCAFAKRDSNDSEVVPRTFIPKSTIRSRKFSPPPVPPKPPTSKQDESYNPENFRRKIEKFENCGRTIAHPRTDETDRCELFGCFSLSSSNSDSVNNNVDSLADKENSELNNGTVLSASPTPTSSPSPKPKRTLRYDSFGRLKGSSDPDVSTEYRAIAKEFPGGHPPSVIYTNVVIRKLTPKLCRKIILCADSTPIEYHEDIRYIDSHSSDAISSQSDIDLNNSVILANCNLSFDSVPKYLADSNSPKDSTYFRSLSAKDVYASLSDIDSTISCLSEESIHCICNNNVKSDENSVSRSGSSQDILINNNNIVCAHSEINRNKSCEFCCCQKNARNRKSLENNSCSSCSCNNSCSKIDSPSPVLLLSTSAGSTVRAPIHRRVPAIESFGYIQPPRTQINDRDRDRDIADKVVMMEKRRNTLDRLHRLGFGRRSSPSPSSAEKHRKTSEKSERLKELTEMLRGTRSSPTPPPVPPPRRPRHGNVSQNNSLETSDKPDMSYLTVSANDDIILMDEEEDSLPSPSPPQSPLSETGRSEITNRNSDSISPSANSDSPSLYQTLKPNTSVSCLESMMSKSDKRGSSKSPPPCVYEERPHNRSSLPRPESRTVIGSYTQRGIPFRSASFSQIDYSSGKYIKSTLSALRDRLRRDKSIEIAPNTPVLCKQSESEEIKSPEPDFIYIPLKKTELNINLRYDMDQEQRMSLEEVVNPPESIPEEEGGSSESDKLQNSSIEAGEEATLSTTLDDEILPETSPTETQPIAIPDNVIDSNLATLMEEELPLESPPEAFLQTATTCLIPVPVYECSAQEWNTENPPPEWVDVAQDEVGIIPEVLEPKTCDDEVQIISHIILPGHEDLNASISQDVLPTISVSHHSNQPSPENSVCENDGFPESPSSAGVPSTQGKTHEKGHSFDFSEVKKRYSNEDYENGEKSLSSDCILPRNSHSDDKRRIDKSKRRKGMYIESTDWVKAANVAAAAADQDKGLAIDMSLVTFPAMKEEPSTMYLNSPPTDDNRTPGSLYSFDPLTPDSDVSTKPPAWPKTNRSSLSCQSSEEKDDSSIGMYSTAKAKQNLMFLRTDSISDNESSDRTPPPSRDRTSPSPAPGDHDFKRYSKRPLRGPYGQMLEAEMKKPNKMYFEEILEELKDSESISPRRTRDHSNRSYDDSVRHIPQHSNSMRVRKNNTHLPIPSHTRAASTPSQMENVTTTARLDSMNPLEKRSLSSLDTTSIGSSIHDKDFKKHSPHLSPKRASSEAPISRGSSKRSQSTDKSPKRSVEDKRLSQSSRTASERSMGTESGGNILATPELLAELLKGSSEKLISEQRQQMFADTRTHVVQEIYRNEQSYVESLQTVVVKYFKVLKTPEYAGMIDSRTVDEIFFMVPDILEIHQKFLSELKSRLDSWDAQQKVGDAFIETFSKTEVLETYTSFVNNCNRAKDAIRTTKQSRPSFARFLETTAREHKGKLSLDNLLIKPVQKFPNYEMLFTRLIKHTDLAHPDQRHLQEVLKLVHDILVHINCKEREILENGQREATLRELEGVIEGISELVAADRTFLLFDLVSMPSGQGARKERGFFLFNDLLVITSIKRRSGTIRKPNTTTCPGSVASTLDTNKYKFLTKVSLDNLDIVKTKDENLRRIMNEIEQLADDYNKLQQIGEIVATVKTPHPMLEDTVRDLQREVQRQLFERQSNDAQLNVLELTVNSPNGPQKLTIVFSKAEKRSQWEESFNEAKLKLAASLERHPIPEFLTSIPIRKTRAGLQFTCAAPTLSEQKDVWVCNSDGYVGQVCVMSLSPEPNVTSCNGVCNARILCVASVPAFNEGNKEEPRRTQNDEFPREFRKSNSSNCHPATDPSDKNPPNSGNSDIQLDSNSSSDDSEAEAGNHHRERIPSPAPAAAIAKVSTQHQHQDSNSDETDGNQSTMWLGTEDGCIHVYNCTDNIRIKKNKIKIQHISAVYSILYLDNRVFVSLANGDICVYLRDNVGWNTNAPLCISIGTVSSPVNKLLNVHGKLWCSIQGIIKVLDTKTLQVEHQIQISSDSKPITNMAVSNTYVWISIQNSAHIKCFHSNNHELIFEVNLAPSVNKMLSNCDDIIRQHKAACLRVTSLLSCKDLIWIGTSAGVLLTIPAQGYGKGTPNVPVVTGIPHGHTGHVRFLTFVETGQDAMATVPSEEPVDAKSKRSSSTANPTTAEPTANMLIISGGDGYEDFRSSGANSLSEIAGREDSTNHLLIWQI